MFPLTVHVISPKQLIWDATYNCLVCKVCTNGSVVSLPNLAAHFAEHGVVPSPTWHQNLAAVNASLIFSSVEELQDRFSHSKDIKPIQGLSITMGYACRAIACMYASKKETTMKTHRYAAHNDAPAYDLAPVQQLVQKNNGHIFPVKVPSMYNLC